MAAGAGSRGARLNWETPTTRDDGTPLDDLVGYRIYFGTDPKALRQRVEICSPSATTWVVTDLAPGIWYFAVAAVDSQNIESKPTTAVSKRID